MHWKTLVLNGSRIDGLAHAIVFVNYAGGIRPFL